MNTLYWDVVEWVIDNHEAAELYLGEDNWNTVWHFTGVLDLLEVGP